MIAYITETLRLGLGNLALHKLRSVLTSLGIILGVAAVIVVVSIGEGNKRSALEDIEALPEGPGLAQALQDRGRGPRGLLSEALQVRLPNLQHLSPQRLFGGRSEDKQPLEKTEGSPSPT